MSNNTSTPKINRVYQHHSGTKYTIVAISNQSATKAGWEVEAVYIDESFNVWTRKATDFLDETKFTLTDDDPVAKIESLI